MKKVFNLCFLIFMIYSNMSSIQSLKLEGNCSLTESGLSLPQKDTPIKKTFTKPTTYEWAIHPSREKTCDTYLKKGSKEHQTCIDNKSEVWKLQTLTYEENEYYCGPKCEAFCKNFSTKCCEKKDKQTSDCSNERNYNNQCKQNNTYHIDARAKITKGQKIFIKTIR